MKHILILAALLAAVACGQKKAESKALVLYYSQTGTTKAVAEALQQQLGADIEEIVAVNSYGEDFGATIARGQKELQEGTLPEIQPIQADIASYDVIFLGYPVWFGTYALQNFQVLPGPVHPHLKGAFFCFVARGVALIPKGRPKALGGGAELFSRVGGLGQQSGIGIKMNAVQAHAAVLQAFRHVYQKGPGRGRA